ncbi:MAG: hypothetical protein KAW61_01230, partial [candidate division Zixibacteria bacterium]|nr:hypothetical protein [candidate division Zixibacteria bacterium]
MFVTNHGNFGRDITGVFGRDAGTFYPYIDNQSIEDGSLNAYVLYANGLWMGGKVSGETRVAIAEYSDDYVPGPMHGGTFMPDNSSFRVYKLYKDSLADNPNWDYLNWPVAQGAPVNQAGSPLMLGDQMLWTVYNDADPYQHTNSAGVTAPLGIEVQQTIWAAADAGPDSIMILRDIVVSQSGSSQIDVNVYISDPTSMTGHVYEVAVEQHPTLGPVWHLVDLFYNDTLYINQTDFSGDLLYESGDGFAFRVSHSGSVFTLFEVVSNSAGPLNPPEAGALWFAGFPVPTEVDTSGWITDGQQVGSGLWAIHTADDGGTNGGGTRGPFSEFVDRVTRAGFNNNAIRGYDYEMRFTGSNDNPGVAGGYAIERYAGDNVFWVPFELWNVGVGTPDDPSDDVRLVPFIIDDANTDWSGDDIYALESWGSDADGTCSGDCEHSASGDDNDPFTDWVYWYNPLDMTPGEAGYLANEAQMLAGTFNDSLLGDEVFARTVLVNWNGGVTPPFNQDCPEKGTVFRIRTRDLTTVPTDKFTFTATPPQYLSTGPEGVSIYVKYNLFNKGGNTIQGFYASLWVDPDLGEHTDDLVGCDTLNDIGFCYNDSTMDTQYGLLPPAVGFKMLQGPLVYTGNISDVGIMWGASWPQYRNMGMTSFNKYINGTDPNDFNETYNYMRGLSAQGYPYMFNGETLLHMHSGDPVTGTGDLDFNPDDRRMMANTG